MWPLLARGSLCQGCVRPWVDLARVQAARADQFSVDWVLGLDWALALVLPALAAIVFGVSWAWLRAEAGSRPGGRPSFFCFAKRKKGRSQVRSATPRLLRRCGVALVLTESQGKYLKWCSPVQCSDSPPIPRPRPAPISKDKQQDGAGESGGYLTMLAGEALPQNSLRAYSASLGQLRQVRARSVGILRYPRAPHPLCFSARPEGWEVQLGPSLRSAWGGAGRGLVRRVGNWGWQSGREAGLRLCPRGRLTGLSWWRCARRASRHRLAQATCW